MLFKADYSHVNEDTDCGAIPDNDDGDDEESCQFCDRAQVVKRKPRDMRIHYGLIASGNQVVKGRYLLRQTQQGSWWQCSLNRQENKALLSCLARTSRHWIPYARGATLPLAQAPEVQSSLRISRTKSSQHVSKKQKRSHPSGPQLLPAIWDNRSKIDLTKHALEELD